VVNGAVETHVGDSFDAYQRLAARTLNPALPREEALFNYTLGLAGESGELVDVVKKVTYHGLHTLVALPMASAECGDLSWYCAALASTVSMPLSLVLSGDSIQAFQKDAAYRFQSSVRPERRAVLCALALDREVARASSMAEALLLGNEDAACDEAVGFAVDAVMRSLARFALATDLTLAAVLEWNIAKLRARYEGGFVEGGGVR
jgi:NTP pyrophosphatase (non-canonical NTP hydrolase)